MEHVMISIEAAVITTVIDFCGLLCLCSYSNQIQTAHSIWPKASICNPTLTLLHIHALAVYLLESIGPYPKTVIEYVTHYNYYLTTRSVLVVLLG